MDFSLDNLFTLGMLTLLQGVLGLDNLLYISLESKRAPADKRSYVRKVGITLAVVLRILLLFALIKVIALFQDPFLDFHWQLVAGAFNIHSVVVLLGGGFIMYTAMKEIFHMLRFEHDEKEATPSGVGSVIVAIVLMNIVFSFDSILSAIALTDVFWVMATAIVIGGVLMIWLSDRVAGFLARNRMYEVLGLFILFVVGIMLVTEGGHLAHLEFFGHEVHAMSKGTFYFVIAVLVVTDVVQSRYQKKLLEETAH